MTDYEELVKALRCANRYKNFTKDCDSQNPNEPCRYCHHWLCEDDRIFEDAAAAIEALQAEVKRLNMRCADCEYASKPWPELEPKRVGWITHPEVKNIYGGVYIECPFCGEKYVVQNVSDEKFCRNCGADMRAKMEVQDGDK